MYEDRGPNRIQCQEQKTRTKNARSKYLEIPFLLELYFAD